MSSRKICVIQNLIFPVALASNLLLERSARMGAYPAAVVKRAMKGQEVILRAMAKKIT